MDSTSQMAREIQWDDIKEEASTLAGALKKW